MTPQKREMLLMFKEFDFLLPYLRKFDILMSKSIYAIILSQDCSIYHLRLIVCDYFPE